MKLILINEVIEEKYVQGDFDLVIDKMSRVIFRTEGKIFSISFPFSVREENDGRLAFHWKSSAPIGSGVISMLRGFIESQHCIEEIGLDDFYEKASEIEKSESEFWELLKVLIFYEDGYFRYEIDPTRENGNIHPLHHFDLFYRTNNAIKLGLHEELNGDTIIDFMDSSTNCYFLKKS
ncbi:MAG: hypothetical protein V4751_10715 [Pseudomonadota bacterium]